MFTKKYIFETKLTRSKRLLRSSLIISVIGVLSFTLLCIYIPIFAKKQNEIAGQVFFKKSPDVIAVFTGDVGRIDYTFKKAEEYPSAKVFISGVYAKNSLETLLKKQGKEISVEQYLAQESHRIEIDYLARNTIENGLATINYLRILPKNKKTLIVSSDYHILRIHQIMKALTSENEKYEFYFESIPTNYQSAHNITKLFKEVYKLIKSSTFLMFWDK